MDYKRGGFVSLLGLFSCFFVAFASVLLTSCEDDEGVGSSIQPEEDVLRSYSNMVSLDSKSVLADSVLSKYSYFLLGRYRDGRFGEMTAEFLTHVDARIGGVVVPDTAVVSSSSASTGILETLLSDINPSYGDILSISSPSDVVVDSTRFYMEFTDNFFGDSTALQAITVYELNNPLPDGRLCTNTKVADYCDKSLQLGRLSYQLQNRRKITIPLKNDLGERILSAYKEGTSVSSQKEFEELFKGFYVSHSFNEGSILQISVAGVQVFYHYDAQIHTTYEGRDTIVLASEVTTDKGVKLNPLVSSIFLSANKSVKQVNVITQEEVASLLPSLNESDYTCTYTPLGLYTAVEIPFDALRDSLKTTGEDSMRVMFNSAKLIFHRKKDDANSKVKASAFLMLIEKDKVLDFFYNNRQPDGISSFVASVDTAGNTYTFNVTAPLQNKFKGVGETFGDDLVLVPVLRSSEDGNYYYRQQLWMTTTLLYNPLCEDEALRPRLDLVYTRR